MTDFLKAKLVALGVLAFAAGFPVVGNAATAADREAILNSCRTVLQLPEAGCQCIADNAEVQLSEAEYGVFVKGISDPASMNTHIVGAGLGGDEVMNITNFMTTAPTQCQNG